MDKDRIMDRLQEQFDAVTSYYPSDRLLGIFLYGSQNYNTDLINSDIDSKVIYLPTFEEFCLKRDWLSEEIYMDNQEHIDVKDIRYMREMFMKQNINFIEILYTDYFILNPKYADLFNQYFIDNREDIAHYDRGKALASISGQLTHTLQQGPRDDKKLYNALRLCYFLEDYFADISYEQCLKQGEPKHSELMRLKSGAMFKDADLQSRDMLMQNILVRVGSLVERYKECDSPRHEAALSALNEGTVALLRASFMELDPEPAVTKDEFKKQLTNAEERAYNSIVNEIGAEGNISISKLVEQYGISRPVYNNLLNKFKEFKIATVTNMGVKGTFIKILHPALKAEAIDF